MIFRLSMWVIMIVGGIAGGYLLDSILFKNIHNNALFHIISFIIGIAVMVLVFRISKNTGRTLAKYGRKGELKRMETDVLVNRGIYSYMRHTMYLGLMLFPLACAIIRFPFIYFNNSSYRNNPYSLSY